MALKLASLVLRRSGTFHQLVSGDHHCGPVGKLVSAGVRGNGDVVRTKDGPSKAVLVKYELTVACSPVLDHRGFLFDQAMVDLWFQRQGARVSSLSCEALTIQLANTLMDKLGRDASHCDLRGVTLQLSPAPHLASLSAHFVRE